jgi:phosphoenolpyruvate synthase/pyruvate phosphate dikinase
VTASAPRVLALADCTAGDVDRVGGKATGLGRLTAEGLDVPAGFVLATDAYRAFLADHGLDERIAGVLEATADATAAARAIHALFDDVDLRDDEVVAAYAALGDEVPVAVRSSAIAEDTADASFAGQQETYLWVVGADAVLHHVLRCWASLYSPQAISYRERIGVPTDQVAMAVVVQRMVEAEAAGVLITLDPVTGDRSQITVEGAFGLGLPVVGGELTPDRWGVDKVTFDMRSRAIATKPFADRFDREAGGVRRVDLPDEEAGQPCLADDEIHRLAELGKQIERVFGGPVDVEWAIGPGPDGPRHLHLLQARPETVHSARPADSSADDDSNAVGRIVSMFTANRGIPT